LKQYRFITLKQLERVEIQIIIVIGGILRELSDANNNMYGFFYLISKIEPLRHLCYSFNKLENKQIR
jgi:hypothetical protein